MTPETFAPLTLPPVLSSLLKRMSERENWTNDHQVVSLLSDFMDQNEVALRDCFSAHPAAAVKLLAYMSTPTVLSALQNIGVGREWLVQSIESDRNGGGFEVIRERFMLIYRGRGLSELFDKERTERVIAALTTG